MIFELGCAGVYPFAGHECARALALMSTEVSDCNDKVDDLGYTERETLRDWTVRVRGGCVYVCCVCGGGGRLWAGNPMMTALHLDSRLQCWLLGRLLTQHWFLECFCCKGSECVVFTL
jgi:hypothetical protein